MALVRTCLSVCFFARSSSRARSRSFLSSTGSTTRPGSLASIPFRFNKRDSSSNSKIKHLQSTNKLTTKQTNRKVHHQNIRKRTTTKRPTTEETTNNIQKRRRNLRKYSRLANFLVSFCVSVRSARAALRANMTHCAADITTGKPVETDCRPADNKYNNISKTQWQKERGNEQLDKLHIRKTI